MKETHSNPPFKSQPFKSLGIRLRYLREHIDESVAEVSGAVEINEEKLLQIEQGFERPSEEILMLLINHFNMHEMEAVQLWELAGYDRQSAPDLTETSLDDGPAKPTIMMLAIDMRTQYTDGVNIHLNNAGLTMTFTQSTGKNNVQPVARVGMSQAQAQAVSDALQRALLQSRYQAQKVLPAPKKTSKGHKKPSDHSDTSDRAK